MALARCGNCGRPHGKSGNNYSANWYSPTGFPESGLVCGSGGCSNPAKVWLLEDEDAQYKKGERIFTITGGHAGAKFRVQ